MKCEYTKEEIIELIDEYYNSLLEEQRYYYNDELPF